MLSHPPLLKPWRQDITERSSPGGVFTRTRALRSKVRVPIDERTELDLRTALDGTRYDVLQAATGLALAPPAPLPAERAATSKRLSETPGAVYKAVWAHSAQPIGMTTFEWTRRRGHEPKDVAKPRSDPQTLQQWFAEYGKPDPNVRIGRRTEFTPSVRIIGNGREAFRTNVRRMQRGEL
ncbi:hypothetical protein KFE25_012598 [Diacronema lutheri]|uniref:Uncharacterized protein n=1 Tax=Diacronema lutheri TaxID=2081491 RepID=A0A8J5XTN3_DIALT|nr:hypothetical protein KFE25_012598 [Diacronema lutheri]